MKSKTFIFLFLLWPLVSMAGGGAAGGGATEYTQLANNTQLVMSYGEQARQTVTQMNQYQAMLRNLKTLSPSGIANSEAQKLWQDHNMNGTFQNLYHVVVGGQQMSYSLSNMDQQFKLINPGAGNYANGFDFQNAYKNWSDTTRSAVMGSLRMAAVQGNDLQSEGDVISALSDASSTADGQMQALQAGNQIGVAMVSQLQKLRQLQISQMQAQNTAALAAQGRQGAADDLLMRAYRGSGNTTIPSYQQIIQQEGAQ
jgi:P-type conjugative transfer protein TrbJ